MCVRGEAPKWLKPFFSYNFTEGVHLQSFAFFHRIGGSIVYSVEKLLQSNSCVLFDASNANWPERHDNVNQYLTPSK